MAPSLTTTALMQSLNTTRVASESAEPSGPTETPASGNAETLTIDRAIEEALNASPELEQVERRIDAAAEQVRQAEAAFFPRVALSQDFSASDNPVFALMYIINQRRLETNTNFNDPGRQQNFSTQIQGEWSLFEGGGSWFNRGAAVNQRRSVEAELLAARSRLVATVSETYYRWLQALAFIDVAERALESARTNEHLAQARLQVEMALPSEVLRLKTQTAEAENGFLTAKTNARKMEAALERLLTRPIAPAEAPDPAQAISSTPLQAEAPPQETDQLVEKALDHRPEMETVRSVVLAARDRVRAAKGGLLPRLAAKSQYEWDAEHLGDAEDSWLIGVQASWSVFEGGLKLSAVREAEARMMEMEARGRQMALDIALEVHHAALAVQDADDKVRVAATQVETARQALEETRNLYENQVVNVDALLQADVAWNRAEVTYMAAVFDGKIARALLRRALGDFADSMEGEKQ
jgi:outer membrane protein TolC